MFLQMNRVDNVLRSVLHLVLDPSLLPPDRRLATCVADVVNMWQTEDQQTYQALSSPNPFSKLPFSWTETGTRWT